MLIEYPDTAQRDAALRRLLGLENHLWLVLGDRRQRAVFDSRQMTTDRVSAVQFVRFPAGNIDRETFLMRAQAGKLAIEVDHPSLAVHAPIAGDLACALSEDLVI